MGASGFNGRVVGADGCRGGWFAIRLDQRDGWDMKVFKTVGDLWREWRDAALILLDVPIGLPEGPQGRRCDEEARQLLGSRRSSVFSPPCRQALDEDSYSLASMTNRRVTGRGLSQQAWAIGRKIKEVDALVRADDLARRRIREVHPEVCFWAFGGGRPMQFWKRTPGGYAERLALLKRLHPGTDVIIEQAIKRFPRREVGRDDILDALAAALTARCNSDRLVSVPESPQLDPCGLPMEMVYCAPA